MSQSGSTTTPDGSEGVDVMSTVQLGRGSDLSQAHGSEVGRRGVHAGVVFFLWRRTWHAIAEGEPRRQRIDEEAKRSSKRARSGTELKGIRG